MAKLSGKVKIKNSMGLHTRPATAIVKLLQDTTSDVYFTCGSDRVNAKSILNLLMLAAKKNTTLLIEVEGDDAEMTFSRLKEGFDNKFGEL